MSRNGPPARRHLFDRFLDKVTTDLRDLPEVLTYRDLAATFRTSILFWKVKVRDGTAPRSFRVGACRRFPRQAVLEWVADRMVEASPDDVTPSPAPPPPQPPRPSRRPPPPPETPGATQ